MRIVVGMSGGVDSSVAAYLLKQAGHEVIGLFMVNWQEADGSCTAEEDFEDVKRVCSALGIAHYSVNYSKQYKDRVFARFLDEYAKGRTPNPDVLCNREIKFGPFLEQARMLGADKIATGHYAKVIEKDGKFLLAKAADQNKDQSYFLCQLSQEQLGSVIFPLEDMQKSEVRAIASKLGLSTAKKKDSTGICFIGERNFRQFLKNYLPSKEGDIVDFATGQVVGRHEGLCYYTLGQRRGMNIGGKVGGNGKRWFVLEKDLKNNVLVVSQGDESPLYSNTLLASEFNFIPCRGEREFDCFAKVRYRQSDQKAHAVVLDDGRVSVRFEALQRAVTPGQYVVLYSKEGLCLGGGVIDEVGRA